MDRYFVGIVPPDEVINEIDLLRDNRKSWYQDKELHLTLVRPFMSKEVNAKDLFIKHQSDCEKVLTYINKITLHTIESRIQFCDRDTIWWRGDFIDDNEVLKDIIKINDVFNVKYDYENWLPHITLANFSNNFNKEDFLSLRKMVIFKPKKLSLFKSIPHLNQRSNYLAIATFNLE